MSKRLVGGIIGCKYKTSLWYLNRFFADGINSNIIGSTVDEQADAVRDCRTRLARPNSQARTNADREIFIFLVQLTTCRIGNLTRLIHTLAIICVTIHDT